MRAKDVLGRRGEEAAVGYLAELGYLILDRNWRCDQGELDIVARDGGELVVCEVKTRSSTTFGTPAEAITPAKAARLRRLACMWAAAHGAGGMPRVDVLGLLPAGPERFTVDHLKGLC